MESSNRKRKRDVVTIETKLQIINELNKGASAVGLSNKYGIPRTTINDLKKNAKQIEKFASQMQCVRGAKKRKVLSKATNETLDEAIYLWFIQRRSEGVPLSGPLISEKALYFNKQLNGDENFKASTGWLEKFKNRHGIRQLNMTGEKLSAASTGEIDEFKKKFQNKMIESGLTRDQVYNADETGLFYKALPTRTLASCTEKFASGFKMQKQRLTLLVCANASGKHRLPLAVIGKSKKPRCFKQLNVNALPVNYYAQKNAWMNRTIFADWFKQVFVPQVQKDLKSKGLPPKAILVLDNAPCHPEEETLTSSDGNVTCFFLLANSTSLMQPMDQSVIETTKRRYRKKFLQQLLSEDEMSLIEFWKKYNVKDVIDNVSDAWSDVSSENLKRSWSKLWPDTEEVSSETIEQTTASNDDFDIERYCPLNEDNNEIDEWLRCDVGVPVYQLLMDEEIIQMVNKEVEANVDSETDTGDEDEENTGNVQDPYKEAEEAASNMQKFIQWLEKQEEADRTDVLLLRRLRNFAAKKSEKSLKQTKVTEFFQKK